MYEIAVLDEILDSALFFYRNITWQQRLIEGKATSLSCYFAGKALSSRNNIKED